MSGATFSDIRSLHAPGLISVVSDLKGGHQNKFLTCGTDGTLYVWDEKAFSSEKPAADVKNVGEQTYSIASWMGDSVFFGYLEMDLISGMDRKRVGMASLDNLEEVTPLLTFNLEPTSIDVSSDFLAAGSSEFLLKIMKREGKTDLANVEVDGEVLYVKIDPKQEFLAAAITDGSVIILDLNGATAEQVPQVARISSVFPSLNTVSVDFPREEMVWSRDGDFLYVPATGSVKIIPRNEWKPLPDGLSAPGRELDAFSVCALSPCGKFLAGSTMKKTICLWNTADRSFVTQYEYSRNSPGKTVITSLQFSPFDQRSLIVADSNEGMCMVKNAVPVKLAAQEKTGNEERIETETVKKNRRRIVESDEEEDDGEEPKRAVETFLDDAADEDTNQSTDIGAIKKRYGFSNQPTINDFFGADGAEREHTDFRDLDKPASSAPVIQKVTQVVEYEPPSIPSHFISGASPKSSSSSRYLKWNRYGMIRSIRDDEINNIEIEFHNSNIHSEIIFENAANYTLGNLSEDAIVLASEVEEDSEELAELWVYHVTAWDGTNRKWTTNLPKGESPVDVMVSRSLIAILTSQRNLRIFTLQGTQRNVVAHPGPTLTAAIFDTRIAVVSLAGSEFYEKGREKRVAQHNYVATVYELDPKKWFHVERNVSTVSVAVRPGETISWIGYTSEGRLCVVDSSYSVRILTRGHLWMPIFDGATVIRSKSDALWPIGVIDGAKKEFRYLYCRGTKYPLISLKINPTVAPWSLSLCQSESEKSQFEEQLLLNELDQNEAILAGRDVHGLIAQHLQSIVKLFALACKSERETRASELAQLVSSSRGIQALVSFATKSKRNVLSEKIASYGREHVSGEQRPSSLHGQEDFLAPKRVLMPRRSGVTPAAAEQVNSQRDLFEESQNDLNCSQNSEFGSVRSLDTSVLDVSLTSPLRQTAARNPFKRAAETSQESGSRSVFDQLEESFENPRKRVREEATKPAAGKQSKLDFGKGKENKVTSYSLWLEENEEQLKKTFSGDVADFPKFCVGQFRILPAAQKKELKERVETMSQ